MNDEQATLFLTKRFGAVGDVIRLAAGEWSTAYAFSRGDERLVARFSATDENFAKDARASRFGSAALPVPRMLEVVPAPDGYVAISEHVEGGSLDALDERAMRAVLPSLFGALDAIRGVDIRETSGFGWWDASGRAPFRKWQDFLLDIRNHGVGPLPNVNSSAPHERFGSSPTGARFFEAAYARLRVLTEGLPEARQLLHADLLSGNVLISDGRVSAVLDWGQSLYGDFLYDIAWFCFWLPLEHPQSTIDFPQEAAKHFASIDLDVPLFEERLRACEVHIGLDGLAYSALKQRWHEIEPRGERLLAIAEGRSL